MAKVRLSILLSLLLIAFPGVVRAQESVRTPDDDPACFGNANKKNVASIAAGRRMNIRVISGQVAALRTDDQSGVTLSSCQDGPSIALIATQKLCADAQSKGYTCSGNFDDGNCGGALDPHPNCCDPNISVLLGASYVCSIPGKGGLRLTRVSNGDEAQVSPTVPNSLNAVNATTNGGNTITSDPLPQHLEGLVRNGLDGVVAWQVFHTQGGANPRTFNVDTTGKTDTQVAQAIANGFQGLGLGLTPSVHPSSQAAFYSQYPQAFFQDDFVVVPDTVNHGVLEIRVNALEGQQITIEDNVPGGNVPTLSTVGMVLLIALLMLGAFLLRRRQLQQT